MDLNQLIEGNVPIFNIFPNTGGSPFSFNQGITEVNYYENILSETVRMTVSFVDTGRGQAGVTGSNKIQISRGEKVYVEIEDFLQQKVSYKTDDTALYISGRDKATDKLREFEIVELTSKEFLINESTRLIKRYDGKISDSVTKILTEGLQTKKQLDIEPTQNQRSFIATMKKPFYFIMWLASQSIRQNTTALGLLAGYYFFETKSGYKFKSIDGLFQQQYTKKYIQTNTVSEPPPGYTGKILESHVIDDADLRDQLQIGTYNSTVNLFNTQQSVYNCNPLDIYQQAPVANSIAAEFGKNLNPDFIDNPSRFFTANESVGNLKEIYQSKELDTIKPEYLASSTSRYNQAFTVKYQITIAADFSLEAGQLIYCDFPEQSDKPDPTYDPRISGVYLISALCHRMDPLKKCYTTLEIIRDAYGRKPMQ